MPTYRVTLGSAELAVRSEPELPNWQRWLEPFGALEHVTDGAAGDLEEVLIGVEVAPPESIGDVDQVMLHAGLIGMRAAGSDGLVFVSLDQPAIYQLNRVEGPDPRPQLALSYPDGADHWELDAFQVVRGWLQAKAEQSGRRKLHGSAAARNGHGLVMVGDTGAGKTSFLLSLLRTKDYSYLANDKLHIDESGTIHGLPMAAAVSVDSLPAVPELRIEPDSRVAEDKLLLWPAELSAALGVESVEQAPLTAVIWCDLDLTREDVTLTELTDEERARLLAGPVTVFTDNVQPQWLLAELGLEAPPAPPPGTGGVPWLRASGNPWSTAWPAAAGKLLA